MHYSNIREEELKNKVAADYFDAFDCTRILGNVDFTVTLTSEDKKQGEIFEIPSLFWAESKSGKSNIYHSITQLILTIGRARTFDKHIPPPFLGALDGEKIAFIPYSSIHDVFYQNDFNWTVTPSNYETKEFKQILGLVKGAIEDDSSLFYFGSDDKEIREFIKKNFIEGKVGATKIKIDKNNFVAIYNKWLNSVRPTIAVDWIIAQKSGIIDADFYLADLLSNENKSLRQSLYVLLNIDKYELDRKIDKAGLHSSKTADFKDNQKAHKLFWNKYERPPKEEYWDYIVDRRDLLVSQDVRERKGSYYTPLKWVELSQQYIADYLGEDWQDEYYVWDCAAGTGNLLAGLTNKYNIWASTLDKQDVDVMHDRIKNGANLLEDHVFQFDFLNDDFSNLPQGLQDIINDEERRKRLVIYINPPYAEASNKKTLEKGKEGNKGVEQSLINKKYARLLGQGNAELFAQFLTRIYCEIPSAVLTEFSKLKILSGQHFIHFRGFFRAKLEKIFLVPADTFDNVKGKFPIGFFIWNTNEQVPFEEAIADVYNRDGDFIGTKGIYAYEDSEYINDWIKPYRADKNDSTVIGKFPFKGNDFQNQNLIAIVHQKMEYNKEAGQFLINKHNLIPASVYYAVRHCIDANWLNDRDQFLFPDERWETDNEFQNDCLAFTLFSNNIQSKYGTNHWIPFTEKEVNAREKFASDFMARFIAGKTKPNEGPLNIFTIVAEPKPHYQKPLVFSDEAKEVFVAGKELWKYYHKQQKDNVNASLYDIREFFQGRNEVGKMHNKSEDDIYMELITSLRKKLRLLSKKIASKVYEYGFLKA